MSGLFIMLAVATSFAFMFFVLTPRIEMLRRAGKLLKEIPQHERAMVYLPFSSTFSPGKQIEMAAKIAEMGEDGWVFLKAGEAHPLKTLRSWGGGLNLHFIRSVADSGCAGR